MVAQLNKLVAQKKKKGEDIDIKAQLLASGGAKGAKGAKGGKGGAGGAGGAGTELTAAGAVGAGQDITSQMSMQQLMNTGRKTMTETEKSIQRSARVVEDTIAIGNQTAAMLAEQTHQMEKIMNDLDEITFSMKKAQKLLGDITRSMATDKCILMFLFLIVGGIVVVIVLKVVKPDFMKGVTISVPLPQKSPPPPAPPPGAAAQSPPPAPAAARRLLREAVAVAGAVRRGEVGAGTAAGWAAVEGARLGGAAEAWATQ
jgi:hypothetical protein